MTYEEIAKGVSKNIRVKKYVSCQTCHGSGAKDKGSVQTCGTCGGSGQVRRLQTLSWANANSYYLSNLQWRGNYITAKCGTCKGEGRVYAEETVSIEVPAGVQEGMQLNISGKGNAGERGGPAGDLIILIEEEAHKELHREGLNVIYDLHISFPDAVFGTQVEVPTIDGRAKIKIPPGTQGGKIFRLKGKGFPGIILIRRETSWFM